MSLQLDYSVLNTDYNNIHSAQQLNKIIYQLKAIIDNKIKHINQLTIIYDKEQQQREIIVRKMTENNTNNSNKIQQFKNLIYSISQQYSKFTSNNQQQIEKHKKSIESNHQLQMAQMNKKIQELQTQYKKVKQFQQLQSDYLNKIQILNKQLVSKQYEHHDTMNLQQSYQMKQNQSLQSQLHQQINHTLKTAPSHAINKITTQLQTNQQQNIHLKHKLYVLQSQLQKLKKQRNQIVNKRKQLKINITLNQQQLQEYKAVGSLQKAKIKAYKDKLQNLKVLISQEISKKQKTINEHKKQRQSNFKVLKLKLFNLQKQKQNLKIKLDKLNLLAQTILQQRTEIQEFFIMALDSCKKEIQTMEKAKHNIHDDKDNKTYGQKVDIDQLLPKDKQRILTNLYTKLAFGMK